jgi:hypothetical protein
VHDAAYEFFSYVPVPKALQWVVSGIEAVSVHNTTGHPSYLLGQSRADGWWYFYLVALAVKTPLPLLLFGLVGLVSLASAGWRSGDLRGLLPLLLVCTFLGFASVFSRINIGVRHVLIVYPLLAIGCVAAWQQCWALSKRVTSVALGRLLRVLVVVLATWQAGALLEWPDYLAYFNELAPEPGHVLIDSDLDWGQDFKRLTRRLSQLHVDRVSLAYLGTADLQREPLPAYTLLQPDQTATGWIAVTALARMKAPLHFAWLDEYRPVERIGRSIDLYFIPAREHAPPPERG